MNNEKLNQWVTVITNIAVVVGILILAIEVRVTRDAVISATYQARATSVQDWDWNIAESTNVSAAILKFSRNQDPATLSEADNFRIIQIGLATFNRLDNFFYQYELGLISEEIYEHEFHAEMSVQVPRMVASNLFEQPYVKLAMRPSFRREIDKYVNDDLFIFE